MVTKHWPVPDWVDLAVDAIERGDVLAWREYRGALNPEVGLWWNEPWLCSVCGPSKRRPEYRLDRTYQDHCHSTGLARGWLCGGCNVQEGKNDNAMWHLWRRTAPMLVVGERWFYGNEGRNQIDLDGARLFTDDELLTLPMDHLLEVAERHRVQRVLKSSAVVADLMQRLLRGTP